MKVLVLLLLFSSAVIVSVISTPVQSCKGGAHEKANDINIIDCAKTPCKFKRKTSAAMEVKFTPTEDIKNLKNTVFAKIIGVPFPFIGVDGTSACGQVYLPDGSKAGCPLKAGQEYVYKNSFKVLEIYPKLRLVVHWALTSENNKDALCFEVPARITS